MDSYATIIVHHRLYVNNFPNPFALNFFLLRFGGNSEGRFRNVYDLLNLQTLQFTTLYNNCIFQGMGKIFSVGFQRYP